MAIRYDGSLQIRAKAGDSGRILAAALELGVFYAGGVDTDQLKTLPDAGVKRAVLPLPSKSAEFGARAGPIWHYVALRGTSRPLHIRAYM